jgi:hypothetical protein
MMHNNETVLILCCCCMHIASCRRALEYHMVLMDTRCILIMLYDRFYVHT